MYIAPCPAGMDRVLQPPPPVLCRNRNGKLGPFLMGFEKTNQFSAKISSATMAEADGLFQSGQQAPSFSVVSESAHSSLHNLEAGK